MLLKLYPGCDINTKLTNAVILLQLDLKVNVVVLLVYFEYILWLVHKDDCKILIVQKIGSIYCKYK